MARELVRCTWGTSVDETYQRYHDREWGVPVHDEHRWFEFLILEGAQAGLSWSTVLNKREGYRRAFAQFDPVKVARFTPKRIEKLLTDPSIIRNRLKLQSAVTNARAFLAVQAALGCFDNYMWAFVGGKPKQNRWRRHEQVPATSAESDAMSKDMKKRGFKFVGSTICYALMQATGLVNDHTTDCFRYRPCARMR